MLGPPPDILDHTALKDLEDTIEVSEVRVVVGEYLGEIPSEHEDEGVSSPEFANSARVGYNYGGGKRDDSSNCP